MENVTTESFCYTSETQLVNQLYFNNWKKKIKRHKEAQGNELSEIKVLWSVTEELTGILSWDCLFKL